MGTIYEEYYSKTLAERAESGYQYPNEIVIQYVPNAITNKERNTNFYDNHLVFEDPYAKVIKHLAYETHNLNSKINNLFNQIEIIQKTFDDRILNVENYLLDKEIQSIIPQLALFEINYFPKHRKYALPTFIISSSNYNFSKLNKILSTKVPIFLIIECGYKFSFNDDKKPIYYSNYKCAIDYFYPNQFQKLNLNGKSNFEVLPYDINNPVYYNSNMNTYFFTYKEKKYMFISDEIGFLIYLN